jgi:hypothetical protein
MTDSHDTTSEYADGTEPMATRVVRTSSSPLRSSSPATQPDSVVITAELPVQRAPSGAVARRPAGPTRARRQPAPVGLRIFVWVLVFLFIVVVVGAIVTAISPSSVSFLRHVTSSGLASSGGGARLLLS